VAPRSSLIRAGAPYQSRRFRVVRSTDELAIRSLSEIEARARAGGRWLCVPHASRTARATEHHPRRKGALSNAGRRCPARCCEWGREDRRRQEPSADRSGLRVAAGSRRSWAEVARPPRTQRSTYATRRGLRRPGRGRRLGRRVSAAARSRSGPTHHLQQLRATGVQGKSVANVRRDERRTLGWRSNRHSHYGYGGWEADRPDDL
jgi:hypothetical protein